MRDIAQTSGDKRLATLRWTLNNLGLTRSSDQVIFHDQFTQACLPLLFGDEWNNHSVRIMQQENLTEISPEVLIMTPRRWGKSVSVSMFVLAMLLSCPGIRIAVFSTGRRASNNLMEMVMKYLKNVPDGESRIVKTNSEQLFIASVPMPQGLGPASQAAKVLQTDPDTSVLLSFPCAIDGTYKYSTYTAIDYMMRCLCANNLFELLNCLMKRLFVNMSQNIIDLFSTICSIHTKIE